MPTHSGLAFYNTSEYSLETLGSTNTRANLEQYISQFSANVRVIFDEFGFVNTIQELDKARLLYRMTSKFAAIDLHPKVVSDRVMSNAYEDLIRQMRRGSMGRAGVSALPVFSLRVMNKTGSNPWDWIYHPL